MILHIKVENYIATYQKEDGVLVCGNTDYKMHFTFDQDWNGVAQKTARFLWNGMYADRDIVDGVCEVPQLDRVFDLQVGVYGGDVSTTTAAYIPCKPSILSEEATLSPEDSIDYENRCKTSADAAAASATSALQSATAAEASAKRSDDNAESARMAADAATEVGNAAQEMAAQAIANAESASTAANEATEIANTARSIANTARTVATTARGTATQADINASNAVSIAEAAQSAANSADESARAASADAANALQLANQTVTSISSMETRINDHNFRLADMEKRVSGMNSHIMTVYMSTNNNHTVQSRLGDYRPIIKIWRLAGKRNTIEFNNGDYTTCIPNPITRLTVDGETVAEIPYQHLTNYGLTENDYIFFRDGRAYYHQRTRFVDYYAYDDHTLQDGESVYGSWYDWGYIIQMKTPIITDISGIFPFDGFVDLTGKTTLCANTLYTESTFQSMAEEYFGYVSHEYAVSNLALLAEK